jgi:hypothetical protein
MNQGGISRALTRAWIDRAHGRTSSYVNNDIGAIEPGRGTADTNAEGSVHLLAKVVAFWQRIVLPRLRDRQKSTQSEVRR